MHAWVAGAVASANFDQNRIHQYRPECRVKPYDHVTPQQPTNCATSTARNRRAFRESSIPRGDGRPVLAQRTALVESIALRLWKEMIAPEEGDPKNLSLVALGGFGRGWLFPYSDIDLLFLYANRANRRSLQR